MAISNCICKTCNHSLVCGIYEKKIAVFSEEVKTPIGVDIKIEKCINYSPTGEEQE